MFGPDSLKGSKWGKSIGVVKGDTRSVDYSLGGPPHPVMVTIWDNGTGFGGLGFWI